MSNAIMPFENIISNLGNDGFVENYYVSQTLEGYKKLEVQVLHNNSFRSFFIITDNGIMIDKRQITIRPFHSMQQRNQEIKRLFFEERMTQVFIGKIFRLSQSTISGIVNS